MSIQWTKRPQNFCRSCGYSWYPRGKSRSAQCPKCGSPEIELAFEGCLRALGYLLLLPFLPLLLLARLAAALVVWLVRVVITVLRLMARAVGYFIPALGRWLGGGAAKLTQVAMPVMKDAAPVVTGAVAELTTRLCKGAYAAMAFAVKWVATVKDDFQGDADRDVNPVSLVAKLMVLATVASLSIILLINTAMFVLSGVR